MNQSQRDGEFTITESPVTHRNKTKSNLKGSVSSDAEQGRDMIG